MANKLFPKGAEKMLRASINFDTDTLKVALVSSAYTYSAAHEFLSDLGTTVGTAQTLGGKSTTGGVFDANDADFGALAPGNTIKAAAIYKDTGSPNTSPLIAYLDEITGFPLATNGGTVTIPWSNGALKIMSMV